MSKKDWSNQIDFRDNGLHGWHSDQEPRVRHQHINEAVRSAMHSGKSEHRARNSVRAALQARLNVGGNRAGPQFRRAAREDLEWIDAAKS
jgi:hypothetical protein